MLNRHGMPKTEVTYFKFRSININTNDSSSSTNSCSLCNLYESNKNKSIPDLVRQREMSCIPLNQLHLDQIQRLLSLLLLVPLSKQHQPLQVILLSTLVSLASFHNEAFTTEIEMTCFICTCSQIFGLCRFAYQGIKMLQKKLEKPIMVKVYKYACDVAFDKSVTQRSGAKRLLHLHDVSY